MDKQLFPHASRRRLPGVGHLHIALATLLFVMLVSTRLTAQESRPRARDIGLGIGLLPTGKWNAITDVPGVRVGHFTLREPPNTCTGITVILPHDRNPFAHRVPAAIVVGNGFGKLVGSTQVAELGNLETPIALTNTLSVFQVANGVLDYVLDLPGNENVRSVNPVVGETNDGFLNHIRKRALQPQHVRQAIENATSTAVLEGCVGAGTGTRCLGFKGGIGTSSRVLKQFDPPITLGVLVQSNFGGSLTVKGARLGDQLGDGFREQLRSSPTPAGSCMIVLATDAAADARQLTRLARRALLGLGAIGSTMSHGSGDYVIAFSTAAEDEAKSRQLLDARLTPLFQATREATEEAILNSMLKATTTRGYQDRVVRAIPIDKLLEACRSHRVLDE